MGEHVTMDKDLLCASVSPSVKRMPVAFTPRVVLKSNCTNIYAKCSEESGYGRGSHGHCPYH